jgi:hypothetical protein
MHFRLVMTHAGDDNDAVDAQGQGVCRILDFVFDPDVDTADNLASEIGARPGAAGTLALALLSLLLGRCCAGAATRWAPGVPPMPRALPGCCAALVLAPTGAGPAPEQQPEHPLPRAATPRAGDEFNLSSTDTEICAAALREWLAKEMPGSENNK